MDREDINQLLKTFKLLSYILKLIIFGTNFSAFCLSGIPLIVNSSYHLFLIEVFWVLLFLFFVYFCLNINLSQMIYFYIICLYLKLKLRNEDGLCTYWKSCKYEIYKETRKQYFPNVDCECGKTVYKCYLPKHLLTRIHFSMIESYNKFKQENFESKSYKLTKLLLKHNSSMIRINGLVWLKNPFKPPRFCWFDWENLKPYEITRLKNGCFWDGEIWRFWKVFWVRNIVDSWKMRWKFGKLENGGARIKIRARTEGYPLLTCVLSVFLNHGASWM